MYPQSDGEVLEYGAMVNPKKGTVENYEECWLDLEAGRVGDEPGYTSWVLRCEDDGRGVKGMLIRIGEHIQGVMRKSKEISVGRWKWTAEQGWSNSVVLGELEPPSVVFGRGPVKEGDIMKGSDELEWVCIEKFTWD